MAITTKKTTDRRNETCPNCGGHMLTEDQLSRVAEHAAERATELMRKQFYQGIGAAIVNRTLWLIGFAAAGVTLWLSSKGIIKLP